MKVKNVLKTILLGGKNKIVTDVKEAVAIELLKRANKQIDKIKEEK